MHRLNYGFDAEGRAVETAPILDTAPPDPEPPPPEKQEAGKQRKLNTKKKPGELLCVPSLVHGACFCGNLAECWAKITKCFGMVVV